MESDLSHKILSGEFVLCDKPARSKVWLLFSRIMNGKGEELDFVWCKSCEKVYKYNHSQTSNLCRHSCYVKKFVNCDNEPTSVDETKPAGQIIDVTVNNLMQLLTKCVIENCRASDLTQSPSVQAVFKEFIELGANFGTDIDVEKLLPSLSEVSENINDVYTRIFQSIKVDISAVKEHGFGFTHDICTDNLTNESYIALTIHYLKNGFVTHRLLGFQILEGSSIRDLNIAESIKRILEEFDCKLSDKCFLVGDGACHFIKTLPDSKNLYCISQLLSNVIIKSIEKLPQVKKIVSACYKLVNFLKKNNHYNLSSKLAHKSYHNRSIAIFKMINSILIKWNEIEEILKDLNEKDMCALNKNKLMDILRVLKPFEEAINTLEDDSHPTLHLVMVYLHELKKFCLTVNDEYNEFDFVKSLLENLHLNLQEMVMKNITTLHKIAIFLYPPTNKLLPYSDEEKQTVENECIRLMKNYTNDTKLLIKQDPDDQPISFSCKRKKLFADFLQTAQNYDASDLVKQEIQTYKNTSVVLTHDFNVFNWWELQKHNFPLLYKLSCTVLTTPATSTASKRVHFKAKSLISEKFGETSAETDVEKIIFININAPGIELDKYLY